MSELEVSWVPLVGQTCEMSMTDGYDWIECVVVANHYLTGRPIVDMSEKGISLLHAEFDSWLFRPMGYRKCQTCNGTGWEYKERHE